ncbi:MAG: radical SAM family heme chaperone HemW [Bacteroidetes bacterium]|nr:radical SAM family heme chaperone HemW [Bacteroidota bacterium]MBI3483366.1 radical SAM family heme chaperone HemW [Bacteroidota bacterium]
MAGLYLHIPFCKQACHYCDFHFSTRQDSKLQLVEAMCMELGLQKDYLGKEAVETIYLGGGTPSLLNERELEEIFTSIRKNFDVSETAEITLEANPDDLSFNNLQVMKKVGVNRLSIGIQSFDDRILKFLNRAHSAREATDCVHQSRIAGFNNISIDLIYAIPSQNDDLWKKNIEQAIAISPEHISAYSLTIEEKTVFGNWLKKGKLKSESDEAAAIQMEILMDLLSHAGYEQYEISNFCKPNFHSRHNSSYWKQQKYLGIGPSAHSYNGSSRQYNIRNNALYIQSMERSKIPSELENLSHANHINEYLLTTLRTIWGCNLDYLTERFNFDLLVERKKEIGQFQLLGLIEKKENVLVLTRRGKLLADKIASDLFVE